MGGWWAAMKCLDFALAVATTVAFTTVVYLVASDARMAPPRPATAEPARPPVPRRGGGTDRGGGSSPVRIPQVRTVPGRGADPARASDGPFSGLLSLFGGSPPSAALPEVWIEVADSGASEGSAAGLDRLHRTNTGRADGCPYHWVIGNGKGGGDGERVFTERGQALSAEGLPAPEDGRVRLRICLVGRFDREEPTLAQNEALIALCRDLCARHGVPPERVVGAAKREGLSIAWLRDRLRQ